MDNRMEEIGDRLEAAACVYPATIDGHAALFNAIGERDEHAADDLVFLWERCASLEALVRELAKIAKAASHLIDEGFSRGRNERHGWELGGERAYLCDATWFDVLQSELSASTALSHPIVSELTGEKEGGE